MKKSKIISCFLLILVFIISIHMYSYAALSFSASSGISTIEVGKQYTVSISAAKMTGRFNVSCSSNVSVSPSSIWVENGVPETNIKVTTKSAGKATVTITPESVADATTGEVLNLSSKTDTVTVNEKSSSGGGNSNSGSSNNIAPSFTTVNETVYAKSQVNVRKSYSTSSTILGSLKAGDSITRTGRSSQWSRVSYNGQIAYISSDYLTTTKPEETDKSNNKNLKSLIVKPSNISPTFSSDITEYAMSVGSDVDSIEVKAVAEDSKAKVSVSGNKDLKEGTNTVTIKVTAEDETVRTYKIIVTKENKEQLKLTQLEIEGIALEPEFSSDVYEYKVKLSSAETKELTITATPNQTDATVEIVGNVDLKSGENPITILVRSADGEETITYQVIATVEAVEDKNTIAGISNQDLYKYIAIAAGGIILLIIIIVIIVRRRKNKDDDFETYYGGYTLEEDKTEKQPEIKEEKIEDDNRIGETKKEPKPSRKNKEKEVEEKTEIQDTNKEEIINKHFGEVDAVSYDDEPKKRRGKHSK